MLSWQQTMVAKYRTWRANPYNMQLSIYIHRTYNPFLNIVHAEVTQTKTLCLGKNLALNLIPTPSKDDLSDNSNLR